MKLTNAKQAEAELERLRIELAILRTAKVRDDLTNLVQNNPFESLNLQDIRKLDDRLHDLEIDARSLVHALPNNSATENSETVPQQPFLLCNPLPDRRSYTIEQVTNKCWNRSQSE